MTDPTAPDDLNPEQRQRMANAFEKIDAAVDAVHINAVSIQRLIDLDFTEVPRLCVQASCRFVEKLIERDRKITAQELLAGTTDPAAKAARLNQIRVAAMDLTEVLEAGLQTTRQICDNIILLALDTPEPPPTVN